MSGTTHGGTLLAATLLLFGAGPVWADDAFTPSNEQIDRDLDQALEREFSGESEPPPPPPPTYMEAPHQEDRGLEIRVGTMAAYYHAFLNDVKLSLVDDGVGGTEVEFASFDGRDEDARFDFDGQGTGTYRSWIDLGKHVSLVGGGRFAQFEDTQVLSNAPGGTPGFEFGKSSFSTGETLNAQFTLMIIDYDVVFKPLNNRWATIELSLGGRYALWDTELSSSSGAREQERLEAVLPMVGFGLALRPIEELTLFGRARVGHIELTYEDDDIESEPETEREHTSLEADIGISLIFEECFGFIAGYRLDYLELSRTKGDDSESVEGVAHGLYGGLIVQF